MQSLKLLFEEFFVSEGLIGTTEKTMEELNRETKKVRFSDENVMMILSDEIKSEILNNNPSFREKRRDLETIDYTHIVKFDKFKDLIEAAEQAFLEKKRNQFNIPPAVSVNGRTFLVKTNIPEVRRKRKYTHSLPRPSTMNMLPIPLPVKVGGKTFAVRS